MNSQEKVQLMMERFVNDNSRFAEQIYVDGTDPHSKRKKGVYFFPVRNGYCNHEPRHKLKDCPDVTEVIFTSSHMMEHLKGERTYAPYQISQNNTIKWVCFDIDSYHDVDPSLIHEKVRAVAANIYKKLGPNHCLVEKSGSKGFHVWIFFSEPIDVALGFALGHELVQEIPTTNDIHIEIYPKQQTNKVFGNTVKLPLGIHQKTGERCWFVGSSFTPRDDQWSALSNVKTIDTSWVKHNITPRFKRVVKDSPNTFKSYAPLCLSTILEEGCSEGIRDEAAFREACYLRDKGIPSSLASVLLDEWNKRNTPPLDDDELTLKIEQAYGENYPFRPCHLPQFDGFCRSSCVFFERKVHQRWFQQKEKTPVGVISRD